MKYLLITLILLNTLDLFNFEFYKQTTYREFGVRLVKDFKSKPALVIGVWKWIVRISL